MGRFEGFILLLVEGGLTAIGCFFLLRFYKAHIVTLDVSCSVLFSWILGFAGILFLPFDLGVAMDNNIDHATDQHTLLGWNLIYWSTFSLAWIVLPLQMEFHSSGHFTWREKLWDSFRRNFLYLSVAIILLIVFIVLMVLSGLDGDVRHLIGFLMAMSNTYGVVLITLLLGSGLIAFPRLLWQTGFPLYQLTKLYLTAELVEGAFQEARYGLEDCERDVHNVSKSQSVLQSPELSGYIFTLQKEVSNFEFRGRLVGRTYSAEDESNRRHADEPNQVVDKMLLVNLHSRLKFAQMRVRSWEKRWENHVKMACRLEEYKKNTRSNMAVLCCRSNDWPAQSSLTDKFAFVYDYCVLNVKSILGNLYHLFLRLFAIVFAVATAVILWSELLMASSLSSPIGLLLENLAMGHTDFMAIQTIALLSLAYMSICTYWSLFRLNLGAMYSLQGPQLSLTPSLIFNAQYFSRLQFALGYNFIIMLNINGAEHTSFNRLMSNMNTIPVFGKSVTVYVPIIMILVALITLFNGYGRLIKYIGMETEDSLVTGAGIFCASVLSEDDVAQLEAGKRLISSATRGMGFSSENGAVHSPLRPTRTLLSSGSPLSASSFKYQMADSGGAVASVDLDEEEDELETVDFSVLFKRETSSSSSGSALLGANSKPKLPGSPSSLAQLNNDQHVDPLNEAIGAGLGKVTSFFRSVASSERVQQFGWGTRPQVSQPLPQFDDDAEITPRMSASLRRQAELESGQVKAASYTGRYK